MSKQGHYSGGHSIIQSGQVTTNDPAEPGKIRGKAKKKATAYFSRLARARTAEDLLNTKHGKKKLGSLGRGLMRDQ
jgi:hypothetical protein